MKTMKIYEPAMCCPTGLCGVGVDPELLRISTTLNTLKQNGVEVERFNLTSAPAEFIKSKTVTEFLQKFGPDKLPVVLVDDFIVIAGRYPTNEEFTSWLELPNDILGGSCCQSNASCCCSEDASADSCCCGEDTSPDSCCCGEDASPESCCCSEDASSESCCCGENASSENCCCGDVPAVENCCTADCCSDASTAGDCCTDTCC